MKYVFVNGIILDGTKDMKPLKNMAVLVDEGKIVDVVPANSSGISGYEVVDLKGQYLLPGLINLHVHLASSGKPPRPNQKPTNYKRLFQVLTASRTVKSVVKKMEAGCAETELMSGVTTIRTVGGVLDFDGQNRDAIKKGKIKGPRILAANTGISVPGGHFAGSIATEAATAEEAVKHVQMIAETHPDLIKLMITGGVMDSSSEGEPGVLRMPPEIVKAACDEAHRLGFTVAAHVESPAGVKVALENGVDTIEHGAKPDEEMIQLFKEKKAVEICTISPALPYCEFTLEESHALPVAKKNGKIVMDGIIACAKACIENDIPVGLGNDVGCPFVLHYNFWRELYYFHKYVGVSNAFSLYTATLRNAEIAKIDDITGSIEKGKSADMIVVKDNPLDDLRALKDVSMVIMEGKIYDHPVVKKNQKVDDLLDKYM
ncbi:MAG: amidohydrolase family protein [Solobacterium sp.]|nr:amidohydrolase family protein [Solobacterium sp.]